MCHHICFTYKHSLIFLAFPIQLLLLFFFLYSFFFYPLQVWHRISNKVRAKSKRKHKVLETQKHEHPKTCSYIPFLDKRGCIQDVSFRLQPSKQKGMTVCVYCFKIFCSVVFMFLEKIPFKIEKKFTFTKTSDVQNLEW